VISGCYKDLGHLPIGIWWDINDTGDVTLLLKKRRFVMFKRVLEAHWINLVNEYIKSYGFSTQYEQILIRKKKLIRYYLKKITDRDKSLQTHINILEKEIKELEDEISIKKVDHFEMKAYLDEQMGFSIDKEKTTVREYMSYFSLLEQKRKDT
jgi:hypothetical protein